MSGASWPDRPCLLVTDDDAVSRAALVSTLREALPDAVLREACTGQEALEILHRGGVDVLLSDVVMPGMDGIELVRRLRDEPLTRGTYVILVSGADDAENLYAALDRGADDYLLKPWGHDELVVRVHAGLRRTGAVRGLEARARELEQLYAKQSEFLSYASHEIRTPLSAILSAASILLRYGQRRPESIERFARVIHQEGQRLTRLINNLLDLAKIESGQIEWHVAPVSVNGLIEQVRESFAALAGERSVQLVVTHAPEAPNVTVDRDKITQVVMNLVSNAIKHSPEGGVIHLRCLAHDGGRVRIEVEDGGSGVPAGQEERIFERFQQIESSDERTGTGLGLTIAREIVEHHRGRIWAEPGHVPGALFVVELPGDAGWGQVDGSV
ncbi:MAG: ATP-binding protein [Acidobacteriota bacterium]